MSLAHVIHSSLQGRQVYFEQDNIVILCGDSASLRSDLLSMDGSLIYADPPYGVSERTMRASNGRSNLALCNDFEPIDGDDQEFDPRPWLSARRLVLWGANYYAHHLPASSSWIVWDKRDGMSSNDNADCEMAWSNLGGPARLFHHKWSGMIRDSEKDEPRVHPTQKPVALARWVIQQASGSRIVIDPFMGSGSTLLAAMDLGLPAIGIDSNERYCEAAKRRIQSRNLDLFSSSKKLKRCSGCKRLIRVELGVTFNRHKAQADGLQPFCRDCDCRQKQEPEKAWRKFQKEMESRKEGEARLWTERTFYGILKDFECKYCGGDVRDWSGGYWIDKVDPSFRYTPENCVCCCWPCNRTKSNRSPEAWTHEIASILSRYDRGKVPWSHINPSFKRMELRTPDLRKYVVPESMSQTSLFLGTQ